MSSSPTTSDVPGCSKNKRRRYFSNGRSRTIELSTLAEIDEEQFAKKESGPSDERVLSTQDDMYIGHTGTFKSVKRGSVKAQAMKLSERLAQKIAAETASRNPNPDKSEFDQQSCSKQPQNPLQPPIQHQCDVKLRRNLTDVRRDPATPQNFEPAEFAAKEWPQHDFQQPNCSVPMQRHAISRSASFVAPAPLFVYSMPPHPQQPDRMSMIEGTRCDSRMGEYMPIYYMPQPAPQPVFVPFMPQNGKMGHLPFDPSTGMVMMAPYGQEMTPMRRKMKSGSSGQNMMGSKKSWCSRICCAGMAQLLWTIVCIISFGIIASLILALCYM